MNRTTRTFRIPPQRGTIPAHARVPGWCGPCHARAIVADTAATYRLWRCPKCTTKWIEAIAPPRPPDPMLNLGRDEAIAECRRAIAQARAARERPAAA